MENVHNDRLPEVHDILKELRKVCDSYPGDRVLIGETAVQDIDALTLMYGTNLDELQLPMNFFFADLNKLSAPDFRLRIAEWDKNSAGGWPVYLFSNHDQVRHYIRYGDKAHNDAIAKLTATMLMTLRGSPILYYGEEIGMENNDPKRKEDVKDPIGIVGWPKEIGRDGERTPMQWDAAANAGFTTGKSTWLPIPASFKTYNVASESEEKNSILNFYKELIKLRRTNDALINGSWVAVDEDNKNVFSYLRKTESENVLVALNMTAEPQTVQYSLTKYGINTTSVRTLLSSPKTSGSSGSLKNLTLPPFGVYIAKVQ